MGRELGVGSGDGDGEGEVDIEERGRSILVETIWSRLQEDA